LQTRAKILAGAGLKGYHRKKIKADPSADSSKAFAINREASIVDIGFSFLELMPAACCALHTFEIKALNT